LWKSFRTQSTQTLELQEAFVDALNEAHGTSIMVSDVFGIGDVVSECGSIRVLLPVLSRTQALFYLTFQDGFSVALDGDVLTFGVVETGSTTDDQHALTTSTSATTTTQDPSYAVGGGTTASPDEMSETTIIILTCVILVALIIVAMIVVYRRNQQPVVSTRILPTRPPKHGVYNAAGTDPALDIHPETAQEPDSETRSPSNDELQQFTEVSSVQDRSTVAEPETESTQSDNTPQHKKGSQAAQPQQSGADANAVSMMAQQEVRSSYDRVTASASILRVHSNGIDILCVCGCYIA